MLTTQFYHNTGFLKEVWGLYGVGVTILLTRTFVRLRTVGIRGFQGDDWIIFLVLGCYTCDAVTVTLTYYNGSNLEYGPNRLAEFNKKELAQIELGSRMELFAWYTYTALLWELKFCMLFFFGRLTMGLDLHAWVKRLAILCGATYIAVFLTITLGCRPFHLNWGTLPYPPMQCTFRAQIMYVATILNIITDAAMLSVPVPLLWKLQVPLKRKMTLAALLSSGLFVIVAALVRITMSLKAHPSALNINLWGVRETIAGIVAVNMPILKPLFTKAFWRGEQHVSRSAQGSRSNPNFGSSGGIFSLRKPAAFEMVDDLPHDESNKQHGRIMINAERSANDAESDLNDDASSQDCIVEKTKAGTAPSIVVRQASDDVEMGWAGVRVEKSYDVRPTTRKDGPQLPSHSANASGPHDRDIERAWGADWQPPRSYEHSIGAGSSSGGVR